MKKIILFLLIISNIGIYAQSLNVFNFDNSKFPTVSAEFYAFDKNNQLLSEFSFSDFKIYENNEERVIKSLNCEHKIQAIDISSVLVIDASGSMFGDMIDIAKYASKAWINMLPTKNSECAITSFSVDNYINQDFTTDKKLLIESLNSLEELSGTDYNAAMLNPPAGGVLIAKNAKYKPCIIFLTDGNPNFEPNTKKIIQEAKSNNIVIHCVTLGNKMPNCMKEFSQQTGGLWFENIVDSNQILSFYQRILMHTQDKKPCTIEWLSKSLCDIQQVNIEMKYIPYNISFNLSENYPQKAFAQLEIQPWIMRIADATPGLRKDTTVKITAINGDIEIKNIISSNPKFSISPTSFFLTAGQSKELKVSISPKDSSYQSTIFKIENSLCNVSFYVKSSFKGVQFEERAVTITSPNGEEVYGVGADTLITWESTSPNDTVSLELSTDNGITWNTITNCASNFKYFWKNIPDVESKECLIRGTLVSKPNYGYSKDEIVIGNQIWMKNNLDVLTYRNGDSINHHEDSARWSKLQNGAWCFYNNNSSLGKIYGKLYNYMAVIDPRGLAPKGWHIPSYEEWEELEKYLNTSIAGGKLKSTGIKDDTGLWEFPNLNATNESGFSALPGGLRNSNGAFQMISQKAFFWSTSKIDSIIANALELSYDTEKLATRYFHKNCGLSVRCLSDLSYNTVLSDTSNRVFSITNPKLEISNIDMKDCIIGDSKDSVIDNFMVNNTKLKIRVDSIFFRGKDKESFLITSSLSNLYITPNENFSTSFRFLPKYYGDHTAEIVIYTQNDTIIKNIWGFGVEPLLSIVSDLIDFGKVNVGDTSDFVNIATIKNISNYKIKILNCKHGKPNDIDFFNGNSSFFELAPQEIKYMNISFRPSKIGKTSGSLEFEYNGIGSPATVHLFGEGIISNRQELLFPSDGAININIDEILKWKANIKDKLYHLQISLDTNFKNNLVDTTLVDTTYIFGNNIYSNFQKFYWRVNQIDSVFETEWSPIWNFTTMMDVVVLKSPINNSINEEINLSFSWINSKYQNIYHLQVSESSDFIDLYKDKFSNKSNSYLISNFDFYRTYYWRVRNEIGDTIGFWSDVWKFKTRMGDIFLYYPEDNEQGLNVEIPFLWFPVQGAEYYQLQISKRDDFTDLVYSKDSIQINEFNVINLEPFTHYFWRVRAWNQENKGKDYWSDVWEFTTGSNSVNEILFNLQISPNPSNDFIYINNIKNKISTLYIYNCFGEKVKVISANLDSETTKIDVSDLPNGIYFIRNSYYLGKFIKK